MDPSTVTLDSRVGARLSGRYRLEARIAAGGMATVYRGRDEVLGRDVAVKIMHPALGSDDSVSDRFRQEAQSAARLNHPNIVTVYDCATDRGETYIVMELVEGTTLRALIERFGRLDPPTVRHVARGIASALDHAHAKGIVHRDVKPENVLVSPDGHVKVVDFGIAKALGPQAARLTTDRPVGTVAYVAPEQLYGNGVDGRADVFALGAMTYEMLTGRPPFTGDSPHAVAAARLNDPVLSPGISPAIDGAVARATAARPESRFETAGEFARALGDGGAPSHLVETARLPSPPVSPSTEHTARHEQVDVLPMQIRVRHRRRKRTRIVLAVALVLAIAAAAAYSMMPKPAVVPEIRGQSVEEAIAALKAQGVELGDVRQVFHDVAEKGTVVDVDPNPGSRVADGSKVTLDVSKGPELFDVPKLIGRALNDAKVAMDEAGFSLTAASRQHHDTVPTGAVISVDPDIDEAKKGAAFTAVVSDGPPLVAVPNVSGKTTDQARGAIEGAGFAYASSQDFSATVPEGTVIGSNPAGGRMAPRGSQVTAIVSKGPKPFPMPDLVGMKLDAAKQRAKSLGLVVRNEYAVPGSGEPKGQVEGQNPPSGTSVRKGTAIDLYFAA